MLFYRSPGKRKRQSNIELLRILAMSGVIFLHYFNADVGGGIAYVQKGSLNELTLCVLEAICICAVNLFVMISAYFLSQSQKRSVGKCIQLLLQVVLYGVALYMLRCAINPKKFSLGRLLLQFLPANWFVVLYVALYLISPLINAAYQVLNKKKRVMMTLLVVVLFSVWPTAVDALSQVTGSELQGLSTLGMYGSGRGYTITQFVVCYCVGLMVHEFDLNRIRFKDQSIRQIHLIALWVIEVLIITIWGCYINPYTGREYCNPVVILEAVTAFVIFLRIDMGESKIINEIASAAFSVYLLHSSFLKFVQIQKFVTGPVVLMLLHIAATIIGVIIISWTVDLLYKAIIFPVNRKLKYIGIYEVSDTE